MMKTKLIAAAVMGVSAIGAASTAHAEENLWLYAKGADTRPQGSWEAKLGVISRLGKDSGDYTFYDIRPEIEYGVTDRLTIGAEIMIFSHDYSVQDEIGPMYETQGSVDVNGDFSYNGERFKDTQYGGFELTAKYMVMSPYKEDNPFGLSVGLGYEKRDVYRLDGGEIDQDSYTATLYLQRNAMDDKLSFVFVPKLELESRTSPGVMEEEIAIDIAAGVSYRFAPKWFGGLEFRHQSDYLNPQEAGVFDPGLKRSSWDLGDIRVGTQHQNGNYFGPTIHYAEENWWATSGILLQVSGGGSEHAYVKNNKNYDEHEEVHFGLTFGYEF